MSTSGGGYNTGLTGQTSMPILSQASPSLQLPKATMDRVHRMAEARRRRSSLKHTSQGEVLLDNQGQGQRKSVKTVVSLPLAVLLQSHTYTWSKHFFVKFKVLNKDL